MSRLLQSDSSTALRLRLRFAQNDSVFVFFQVFRCIPNKEPSPKLVILSEAQSKDLKAIVHTFFIYALALETRSGDMKTFPVPVPGSRKKENRIE